VWRGGGENAADRNDLAVRQTDYKFLEQFCWFCGMIHLLNLPVKNILEPGLKISKTDQITISTLYRIELRIWPNCDQPLSCTPAQLAYSGCVLATATDRTIEMILFISLDYFSYVIQNWSIPPNRLN
jgi:hypothetical protein